MNAISVAPGRSPVAAWARALERTSPISGNPRRILPLVVGEMADRMEDAPALISDSERLDYRGLAARSNRYAHWALDAGVVQGEAVCLLMPNRPEYMAIWLGVTRVGGIVSLVNTQLEGSSLAHAIDTVSPRHIIVDAALLDSLTPILGRITGAFHVWVHGKPNGSSPCVHRRIDIEIERYGGEPPGASQPTARIWDTALYIYTSGTTGLPKAARVSHYRLMQWSHWFAGMMDVRPDDRMYNALPLYHSVGGVVGTGAVLVAGGSVVVREKFSAREFWTDIARWDCTLFQYIGELCRYLLNHEPRASEATHRVRMCCGNGLRPEVWSEFKDRFRIPQILEFYASTEGNVSLFNVEGQPGAIGRIPSYLAHRFPVALVRTGPENGEPVRDETGRCVRVPRGDAGEAIGRISEDGIGSRFEGYTSSDATERKILRDVFEPGDAWFRTGDLMRRDSRGYFYFVDRIGDTFRWKGENVSTSEVSAAICAFPGVREAVVYGVRVPSTDGRAGMAAVVAGQRPDLGEFRAHLAGNLPSYARPLFVRFSDGLSVTGTFKYTKRDLVEEGYDPAVTRDAVYFNDTAGNRFVRMDPDLFGRIQRGLVRL